MCLPLVVKLHAIRLRINTFTIKLIFWLASGEIKQVQHLNNRSSVKTGRGRIPNRVDISERPAFIEEKSRIGDWEADTIISAGSKTALVTLVDRCSKITLIKKIGDKTAENTCKAIIC